VLPALLVLYVGQLSHARGPVAALYLPVAHAAQLGGFPVYPALHTQLLLAAGDCELEGQATQTSMLVDAVYIENVPGGHAAHAPGPEVFLYVPATHQAQAVLAPE